MFKTTKAIKEMNPTTLYRMLMKNIKYYPSKNRFEIMLEIKHEFRRHISLKEPKLLSIELKKARIGVAHILMYKEK